jgi:hypothetical protein
MWNPFSDATQGAVKGLGEAVATAVGAFRADPTKTLELQAAIEQAAMKFQSEALQAVNATMQAEAKSEHWMQWAWRPSFGFTACAILVNNYVLLPYFAKLGVVAIVVPAEVWMMIAAVLGVAAYVRGRDK